MAYFIQLTGTAGKKVIVNIDNIFDIHPNDSGGTRIVSVAPAKDGHHTITVKEDLYEIFQQIPSEMHSSDVRA
jgi:hypothetical protein